MTIAIARNVMTTDNRTSEPTPEQVEAAAKAMHGTGNPWFAAYGDWGAAGFEIKKAFRESARAALVAAAPIQQPVIDEAALAEVIFDAWAERESYEPGYDDLSQLDRSRWESLARAVAAWFKGGAR